MDNVWSVPVGNNATFYPYLINNNRAITTYTGSESVQAKVWQGDDTDELPGVVTMAFDATQALTGKTTATVVGSATSALTPGYYSLRCEIQLNSAWFEYYRGFLVLEDSPGTADEPDTYCSLQDMLDLGGEWLPRLMGSSGRSNFIAERAKAKAHIDRVILSRCRSSTGTGSGYLVQYLYSSPLYGSELEDQYFKDLLDAGTTLVQDAELKTMAAHYAISLVCQKAMSWEQGDPFMMRHRFHQAKFNQSVFGYVAKFDLDADGTPEVGITLGRFSTR